MKTSGFHIKSMPALKKPMVIAGFDGWGNALNVSSSMVSYLVRKLDAIHFADIDADTFFRYDDSRPIVVIQDGELQSVDPPKGRLYYVDQESAGCELIILVADEPNLAWHRFAEALGDLAGELNASMLITLGSMFDNVLPRDNIVSAIASPMSLLSTLEGRTIKRINYSGPSAVHSVVHAKAVEMGLPALSLWAHCPYYLQGVTHFGALAHLGGLLSELGGFVLDVAELDVKWEALYAQLVDLIDTDPKLKNMIDDIRKAKVRGSWSGMAKSIGDNGKVINLGDYMD